MDVQPTVQRLIDKGVRVLAPHSLDVGPEVDIDRISGEGVTIYPGCRIYGAHTVISSGVTLGQEGTITLEDCQLGRGVSLRGGYAARSVFLEGASLGFAAHVRAGTILEEGVAGRAYVSLKQTILEPFVTLGSHINFCDCHMSGGRSTDEHSEVGSQYVHFNFTPDGDKTTSSLFGDVPHGVMLDQPPIFLGGQGGSVGPVMVGFGSVVSAGAVQHEDVGPAMRFSAGPAARVREHHAPRYYRGLNELVAKNLLYLANLHCLTAWYAHVRRPFFDTVEFGEHLHRGALEAIDYDRQQRVERLMAMLGRVPTGNAAAKPMREHLEQVCRDFAAAPAAPAADLLAALTAGARAGTVYVESVKSLDPAVRKAGTDWLGGLVDGLWAQAGTVLPAVTKIHRHAFV